MVSGEHARALAKRAARISNDRSLLDDVQLDDWQAVTSTSANDITIELKNVTTESIMNSAHQIFPQMLLAGFVRPAAKALASYIVVSRSAASSLVHSVVRARPCRGCCSNRRRWCCWRKS